MSTTETGSGSGFSPGWWIAGGFLLLVVLAGGIYAGVAIAGNKQDEPQSSSSGSAAPTAPTASVETSKSAGGCGDVVTDHVIPTAGPDAQWKSEGFFYYPTSDVYGPKPSGTSDSWGCFQHSPTGALFAAANFWNSVGATTGEQRLAVYDAAVVPNAAATQFRQQVANSPTPTDSSQVGQLSGFQFLTVQDDEVAALYRLTQGGEDYSVTLVTTWDSTAGTWKIDVAKSTIDAPTKATTAYTSWGAGRN